MAGSLEGRVAFITGVARGQGRAHAVRLAREGVDIIGVDVCENYPHMNYPNASQEDLDETAALVEKEGRRIVARKADVRDFAQLKAAFDEGYAEFGRVDIVISNAGIIRLGDEQDPIAEWQEVIETNLTGAFHTVRAALPGLKAGGRGGSIVITSSTAGLKGTGSPFASAQAYTAAKRGLVGYMQTLANDLAPEWIRVNTIHPTGVDSPMSNNDFFPKWLDDHEELGNAMRFNLMPVDAMPMADVSAVVAFLCSDEAKWITGSTVQVDAGFMLK